MKSDSTVKAILIFVAVVCAGCRDEAGREPEHVVSDNVASSAAVEKEKDKCRQVRNEGETVRASEYIASDNVDSAVTVVEKEIGNCQQMLDVGGWKAAIWSSSVAKSILALDDAAQQKRLVDAYLAHLAALDPLSDTHKSTSTALFNYSMMLDVYLSLYKFPDAEEKLFGLICRCVRLYRTAINNFAVEAEGNAASPRRLALKHEGEFLMKDLNMYSNYVERTYFSWALSHGMPKERCDHWRRRFLDAFAGHGRISGDADNSAEATREGAFPPR